MEASFRSRIDRTFGFLNDAKSDGDTHLWNVEERAASKKNKGLSHGAGEGDSDDEEASGYADFLKSGNARRHEDQGERSNASFFGEEDIKDLDSGGEGEDDDEEEEEEEDVEEQIRVGKKNKKGGGEQTDIEVVNRARVEGLGAGPSESSKVEEEDDDDDETREVRGMVGMDDTLDFEDEEDEYDKVAIGREGADDRLFMSQVKNFGPSRQQMNSLPTSFAEMRQASRDRRANHKAAMARLEEDDREAAARATKELSQATEEFKIEKLDIVEDRNVVESVRIRQDNGEAMDIDGDRHKEEPIAEARDETRKSVAGNLESCRVSEGKQRISGKRVRFLVDEAAGTESNAERPDQMLQVASTYPYIPDDTPSAAITRSVVHSKVATSNRYSKVPDHVKNPSKYIHYTLDWSDEDEEKTNVAAFNAARAVSSSTQDMVTDKQEEALVESQGPSGSTKISFNPLVSLSKRSSKESGRGVSKDSREMDIDASTGVLTKGVVNVAANFDMDSVLGGMITTEDDQDLSASSHSVGQVKSGRVVRRYRNRATDDIEGLDCPDCTAFK